MQGKKSYNKTLSLKTIISFYINLKHISEVKLKAQ